MIGCTSTFTQGAVRRARYALDAGADAIQLALPFWMVLTDSEVVSFFETVAAAVPGLPLSLYETQRAKRELPLELHQQLHAAVPDLLMVKCTGSTLGTTRQGCAALSELYNVFIGEHLIHELGPYGACGSCSSLIYMNPPFVLRMFELLEAGDYEALEPLSDQVRRFFAEALTGVLARGCLDSALDRLLGRCLGFLQTSLQCRAPYACCTPDDVAAVRSWLENNTPDLASRS
jgi:dihydrodipicolinate synthase/N-acetylneuraminate lyase